MRLFKRKVNKAKKGIQALILCSGAASLLALPSYFERLSSKFKQDSSQNNQQPIARRAQSMSIIPKDRIEIDEDFDDFEQECAQMEAHRSGLILNLEQVELEPLKEREKPGLPIGDKRYPGLNVRDIQIPKTTQPRHSMKTRRVHSAPCVALSLLPPNLLDEIDNWETDEFTLNEEWIIPNVKSKALKTPQQIVVETWDTDFDVDLDDIEIPNYVKNIQTKFKADMMYMRKFALHMEDLKKMYADTIVLEAGMLKQYPDLVNALKLESSNLFEEIQVLMILADYKEDEGCALSQDNFDLLNEMLQDCKDFSADSSNSIMFGGESMELLLGRIPALKRQVIGYVNDLKDLMVQ